MENNNTTEVNLDDRESDFKLAQKSEYVIFQPFNQLMAKPNRREQDLMPQWIYFFKHYGYEEPKIVYYDEQQAALMLKSSHKQFLRGIGCSDGSTYLKYIRNCGVKPGQRILLSQAQEILDKALAAELEVAKQNGFKRPEDQNVHFDRSYPLKMRDSFVPPA